MMLSNLSFPTLVVNAHLRCICTSRRSYLPSGKHRARSIMRDDIHFYIDFIKEVQNNPILYNQNQHDHNVRIVSETIWARIGEKLGETALDCKNKWKTIRCNYTRSLNTKAKNGTNNGRKDYYLSPYLQFLNPFIKLKPQDEAEPNRTPVNYSDESLDNNNEQETDDFEAKHTDANATDSAKKDKRKRDISDVYECIIDNLNEKRKRSEIAEQQKDHCELYLLSLAPHLKTMTPREQLRFQIGVVKLIKKIKYSEPS